MTVVPTPVSDLNIKHKVSNADLEYILDLRDYLYNLNTGLLELLKNWGATQKLDGRSTQNNQILYIFWVDFWEIR